MEFFYTYLICLTATVLLLCGVFLIAKWLKRFDLVDAAWGWAFIIPAVTSYLLQTDRVFEWDVQTVVTLLVIIWGVRLSWHILQRIRHTDVEDPRYVELHKKWRGNLHVNIFFRIYMVQALLALIVVTPVLLINFSQDHVWSDLTTFGIVIWMFGFLFEVISDHQLRLFVTDSAHHGKIMTHGLWKYSRHPNYFGELVQWWGIFIVCLGIPFGWIGTIGPLLISYLILFVSGIPLNEKRFQGRPGWDEYHKRTSVIVPLPPRY